MNSQRPMPQLIAEAIAITPRLLTFAAMSILPYGRICKKTASPENMISPTPASRYHTSPALVGRPAKVPEPSRRIRCRIVSEGGKYLVVLEMHHLDVVK